VWAAAQHLGWTHGVQEAAAPDNELGGPQIYAIRVAGRKPHGGLLQCNLMLRAPRSDD